MTTPDFYDTNRAWVLLVALLALSALAAFYALKP